MSRAGSEVNGRIAALCLGPLMAESVEVTARQFSRINALFSQMVAILDIRPVPRLFLEGSPSPQAFTVGLGAQAYVAISSGLVRELDEEGLCFVFGHELGHVRSSHTLARTVAELVVAEWKQRPGAADLGFAEAYLQWSRAAEITADRAGLLACQDTDVACRALLTILLGSRQLASQVNLDEYLSSQSREIELNAEALLFQKDNTHPLIPFRLQELLKFSRSRSYARLLSQAMVLGESAETISERAYMEEMNALEAIRIDLG